MLLLLLVGASIGGGDVEGVVCLEEAPARKPRPRNGLTRPDIELLPLLLLLLLLFNDGGDGVRELGGNSVIIANDVFR